MRGTILVEGGRIRATDTGGDGPALILLHGDWTDSGIWARLVPLLRDRFRVVAYDEPGYGDSPPPTCSHTRTGNLRGLLDRLGVERAVLVAHSGGANPALSLALAEPERVRSLVLVAPGMHDYPWPADDPYVAEFTWLESLRNRGGLVALGLRTWASAGVAPQAGVASRAGAPTSREAGVERIARKLFRRATAAWDRNALLRLDEPPLHDRLGDITVPATVVTGELEYPMVRDCADDIAARIKGTTTTVVPGCDHMLPLRAPDILARIISETVASP